MEAFRETKARKWHEKELYVRIKEMHTDMRKAELEEEEFWQHEETIKKREEELRLRE
jgi:hypothetical protein